MPIKYFTIVLKHNYSTNQQLHQITKLKNVTDIKVTCACIPQSRYIIHKHNHFFFLVDENGSSDRVNLPQSNFANTRARLAEIVQSSIRSQVPNRSNFQCLITSDKIVFRDAQFFVIEFGKSTLYRNLGMNKSPTQNSSMNPEHNLFEIKAPNPPSRYTMHIYRVVLSAKGIPFPGQTLAHVITRRDDSITYYVPPSSAMRRTSPVFRPALPVLSTFALQILDDNNNVVEFNHIHATIVLAVTYGLQ